MFLELTNFKIYEIWLFWFSHSSRLSLRNLLYFLTYSKTNWKIIFYPLMKLFEPFSKSFSDFISRHILLESLIAKMSPFMSLFKSNSSKLMKSDLGVVWKFLLVFWAYFETKICRSSCDTLLILFKIVIKSRF